MRKYTQEPFSRVFHIAVMGKITVFPISRVAHRTSMQTGFSACLFSLVISWLKDCKEEIEQKIGQLLESILGFKFSLVTKT